MLCPSAALILGDGCHTGVRMLQEGAGSVQTSDCNRPQPPRTASTGTGDRRTVNRHRLITIPPPKTSGCDSQKKKKKKKERKERKRKISFLKDSPVRHTNVQLLIGALRAPGSPGTEAPYPFQVANRLIQALPSPPHSDTERPHTPHSWSMNRVAMARRLY